MRGYGHVGLLIYHVLCKTVSAFHQCVEVVSRWVHGHPSWVVPLARRFDTAYSGELTGFRVLLVAPNPVGPHVRRVQVALCGIKRHAVDCSLGAVFVVLDVLLEPAILIHGEDVAEAGVVVEWVTVDVVRWLLCREDENGPRLGVCIVCLWVASQRMRRLVNNLGRALHSEAVPLFHASAIYVLFCMLKRRIRLRLELSVLLTFTRKSNFTHIKGHP